MKPINLFLILSTFIALVGCELFIPDGIDDPLYCPVQSTETILRGVSNPEDHSAWINSCDNVYNIQGPVFVYSDQNGSTANDKLSNAANGQFCFEGDLVRVSNWEAQWGAGLQFRLCQNNDIQEPSQAHYPIGSCPRGLSNLKGMTATITGAISTGNEIRVTFTETGRQLNTYILGQINKGPTSYAFADAKVHFDTTQPPINIQNVEAITFEAKTTNTSAGSYSVCISNISFF